MQRPEAKIRFERPQMSSEIESRNQSGDIPAETGHFQSTTDSEVWRDWVVGLVWTKLPAPHSVIEPVSQFEGISGDV